MKDTYAQLMSRIPDQEPSEKILATVSGRIEKAQIARLRLRAFSYGGAALVSIVALIPLLRSVADGLAQSGFYQYASLIVSDGSYALTQWKDIALSIADSLPVSMIALSVTAVLIFAGAIRQSVRYRASLSAHRQHLLRGARATA